MSLGQNHAPRHCLDVCRQYGGQVLAFLFGIVLARLLAPEDFGVLLTIQVFTGLAGFVAGGGMGQALVRAKEAQQDYDIVFTLQLGIGCLIYAGFFLAAPWFAKWYDNPLYTDLLRVSALSFIFRPLVNLPASILFRQMRYKAQTIVGLTSLLVSSFTSIFLAWLGYGVWSLIWGGIAGSVYNAAALIPLARWRPGFSLEFRRGRDIARYGMLVSANDIVGYLRNQTSIFILSRTSGPASVGLYNKGESLAKCRTNSSPDRSTRFCFVPWPPSRTTSTNAATSFSQHRAGGRVCHPLLYRPAVAGRTPDPRRVWRKVGRGRRALMILAFAWPFWLMNNLSGAVLAAQNWLGPSLKSRPPPWSSRPWVFLALPYGIDGVAWAIVGASRIQQLRHAVSGTEMPQGKMAGQPARIGAGDLAEWHTRRHTVSSRTGG
jgi:teichuronic acid exporter